MSQARNVLDAHESTVFNLGEDWERIDDVPRYLFRVCTPRSGGLTDETWAKSADARRRTGDWRCDIFARSDRMRVAVMIRKHLRWEVKPREEDNLVSWTSSLLFALQFIFYRHYSAKDGSDLSAIRLYVVDTTLFPKGTFVKDMHLIEAFASYDEELKSFGDFRKSKREDLNSSFYFGEYLTQGALRIEGEHSSVSAETLIDCGLYKLLPELEQALSPEHTPLANRVIAFRRAYFGKHREVDGSQIRAGFNIAAVFGYQWRLPMAAYLVALLPVRNNEPQILKAFK